MCLFFPPPVAFEHLIWLGKTCQHFQLFLRYLWYCLYFVSLHCFLHVKPYPYHFTKTILIKVVSELYTEWSRPISDLILLSSWVILDTVDCCFLKYFLGFCDVLCPVFTFTSLTGFSQSLL